MSAKWTLGRTEVGTRVEFGDGQETLPGWFKVWANYKDPEMTVFLEGELSGSPNQDRIVIHRVDVTGRSLTPRQLSYLQLAALVYDIGLKLLEHGPLGEISNRQDRRLTDDELQMIAAVYQRHHAIWGNPTQAVQAVWGIPRATANRWLRKARTIYNLPG